MEPFLASDLWKKTQLRMRFTSQLFHMYRSTLIPGQTAAIIHRVSRNEATFLEMI